MKEKTYLHLRNQKTVLFLSFLCCIPLSFGAEKRLPLDLPTFTKLIKPGESSNKEDQLFDNKNAPESTEEKNHNLVVTFKNDNVSKILQEAEQVSVDFVNEDIKQVLRYIAELYDLNIIIPSALTGSVTIRLKNATWESLLDSVLTPVNCSYIKNGDIIQICTIEDLIKEPLKTETFLLKFASAKQLSTELKDFIDTAHDGKINFNERSNILIVTERAKNMMNISKLIETLDKPESQVMIEAKFIEMTDNRKDSLGFRWPTALSAFLQASDTKSDSGNGNGSSSSSSSSDNKEGEIACGLSNSKIFRSKELVVRGLTASFNFEKADNLGKTLSSPTIITMNNVPATMSVTDNQPIPSYSTSDNGNMEISGFEEKPIGIELKVTPKVQEEYITLEIEPSLSTKTGTVQFQASSSGASVSLPIISKKATKSTITIKSGYTLAIGGLLSDSNSHQTSSTPFLGEIPILGNLFSNKEKTNTISNLIIFLSATQIGYDGTLLYPTVKEARNVTQKQMYDMHITDNDLPGESLTEEEESTYKEIKKLRNRVNKMRQNQDQRKVHKSLKNKIKKINLANKAESDPRTATRLKRHKWTYPKTIYKP